MTSKINLAQVLKAYDYANNHPHKYLRGTTNWCAAIAHSLNEQVAPLSPDHSGGGAGMALPERQEKYPHQCEENWEIQGWNACLDKVKELNQ